MMKINLSTGIKLLFLRTGAGLKKYINRFFIFNGVNFSSSASIVIKALSANIVYGTIVNGITTFFFKLDYISFIKI